MQSEVAWWSDLATKLAAPRTVPEAFETYAKCVSERMKMAATTVAYWQMKLSKSLKKSQSH
jgi:hypothetical protein